MSLKNLLNFVEISKDSFSSNAASKKIVYIGASHRDFVLTSIHDTPNDLGIDFFLDRSLSWSDLNESDFYGMILRSIANPRTPFVLKGDRVVGENIIRKKEDEEFPLLNPCLIIKKTQNHISEIIYHRLKYILIDLSTEKVKFLAKDLPTPLSEDLLQWKKDDQKYSKSFPKDNNFEILNALFPGLKTKEQIDLINSEFLQDYNVKKFIKKYSSLMENTISGIVERA